MGDARSGLEPNWNTTDPEVFMMAVRRSDGPVRVVRTYAELYDDDLGFEVPHIRAFCAVRAETDEGWGTFRYAEYLPVEPVTGRIVTTKGTVYRWLLETVPGRVCVDRTRSGAL